MRRKLAHLVEPLAEDISDASDERVVLESLKACPVSLSKRVLIGCYELRGEPPQRAEHVCLHIARGEPREIHGRLRRDILNSADYLSAVFREVLTEVSALAGNVVCLVNDFPYAVSGVEQGFQYVVELFYGRRLHAIPALAGEDAADNIAQFLAIDDYAAEASDHIVHHGSQNAFCRQLTFFIAVIIAFSLPEVYEVIYCRAPGRIEYPCRKSRSDSSPRSALRPRIRIVFLVVLCLADGLTKCVIRLRRVGFEHCESAQHRIAGLADSRVVHSVGHGLTAVHGSVELGGDSPIKRTLSGVNLLLRADFELRLLAAHFVFGPGPKCACRPAVHAGNGPAAEDGSEEHVPLRPVRMFFELLCLRRCVPHETPVELRCVLADELAVDLRELPRARNIFHAEICPAERYAAQLFDDDARVCTEDGGDVVRPEFIRRT